MKALHLFVLALTTLALTSCSQKPGSKTLQVTTSLAVGTAGFTGGLVVHGKSLEGKTFTANAIGGTSLTVVIENGTWTINAVGWDGAQAFAGDVHCGTTTQTLTAETTTINLTANTANCNNPVFTSGMTGLYDATSGFKTLRFYSCGGLYYQDASAYYPVTSSTIESMFGPNFCTSSEIPKDFMDVAKSFKIEIDGNLTPGTTYPVISSGCFPGVAQGFTSSNRIPTNGFPIKVTIYEDTSCSSDPIEFFFPNGLMAGSSEFDSIVNNQGTISYNLILPVNKIRRGYSAMMNMLPNMSCSGLDCLPKPAAGIPADYHLYNNGDFQEVRIPEATSCAQLTITAGTGLIVPASPDHCKMDHGDVFIMIKSETSACSSTPCSATIVVNGSTYTRTFSANQSNSTERNAYDSIWWLIGSTASPSTFFDFFQRGNSGEGMINRIRQELGPDSPIGLFGNITCSSLAGKKSITLLEDGLTKSYEVEATATTKSIPTLLCENQSPNATTCTTNPTFDKKIVLREKVGSGLNTRSVTYLDCDNKIGLFETHRNDFEDSRTRIEKHLAGWNTQDAIYSRLESLEHEKELDSSNVLEYERSSFQRAEVTSVGLKGQILQWDASQDGASFKEYLSHKDFYVVANELNFVQKSIEKTSTASGDIFNTPYLEQYFQVPYLARDSSQTKSPDGSKMARAWTEYDSSTSTNKVFTSYFSSGWTHPGSSTDYVSSPGTAIASHPRVAVDNNGVMLVVWAEYVSTPAYSIKLRRKVSNTWDSTTINLSPASVSASDSKPHICMDGTYAAVVWQQHDATSGKKRIYLATTATLSTTNTWSYPSSLSTDGISDDSYDSFTPKCVLNGSDIFVAYQQNGLVKVVKNTMASYSLTVANLLAYEVTSNPSGVYINSDIYISKDANNVYVNYFDSVNQQLFKSYYSFSAAGWTHPTDVTDGISMRVEQPWVYTKNISENFGTNGTYMGTPPNGLKVPSYNNLKSVNNFGLKELRPSYINGIFTDAPTFIAQ